MYVSMTLTRAKIRDNPAVDNAHDGTCFVHISNDLAISVDVDEAETFASLFAEAAAKLGSSRAYCERTPGAAP